MTDAVTISLISAFASTVAAVLGFLNNRMGQRNAAHIEETKAAVVTLEKNTNSIKDELVRVTGQAEFAKGLKQGTETQADQATAPKLQG